ncbi:hypothetical protein LguiB_024429 [Lonicera macranthoides]
MKNEKKKKNRWWGKRKEEEGWEKSDSGKNKKNRWWGKREEEEGWGKSDSGKKRRKRDTGRIVKTGLTGIRSHKNSEVKCSGAEAWLDATQSGPRKVRCVDENVDSLGGKDVMPCERGLLPEYDVSTRTSIPFGGKDVTPYKQRVLPWEEELNCLDIGEAPVEGKQALVGDWTSAYWGQQANVVESVAQFLKEMIKVGGKAGALSDFVTVAVRTRVLDARGSSWATIPLLP